MTLRSVRALLVSLFVIGAIAGCGDDAGTGPRRTAASIQFVNLSQPVDLTPDGSIAAIVDGNTLAGDLYFYHTKSGLLEHETRVGDALRTFATGISANGTVTALHNEPVQAGFWTRDGEWTDIASSYKTGCDQDIAAAWDISADAHVIVGLVWDGCAATAFRWDATGSGIMTPLQRLGSNFPGDTTPPSNRATKISDDGSTIGGFAQTSLVDRHPAIWKADGTGFLLSGSPSLDTPGEVLSVSADGKMVAGVWGTDAFYWTEGTGSVIIGKLPDADPTYDITFANAIAAGGKLIFGGCGSPFFTLPRAFVWTSGAGMRPLADVLTANGVTIPDGYYLTNVLAASADGTILIGTAYDPNSAQVTFVVHLPVSAYGL